MKASHFAGLSEASADRRPHKPGARRALLRGTCLSGAAAVLLVLSPQIARAADECGAPVEGVVTCPAGTDLSSGVTYQVDPPTPEDLTINLGGNQITTAEDLQFGVVATNLNGAVTVNGGTTNIVTYGAGASGIFAATDHGDVTVDIGDVTIFGDKAGGIDVSTSGGLVTINAGSVAAYGEGSSGINVLSNSGDVHVDVGFVGALDGRAIEVQAAGGAATISAGSVLTGGNGSVGVYAVVGGALSITTGDVTTYGGGSSGILAVAGTAAAGGDPGAAPGGLAGITDVPSDHLSVQAGDISTWGPASAGIVAANYGAGGVDISAQSISTQGANSSGVLALGHGGDIRIGAGSVATNGGSSAGVTAINYAAGGAIVIQAGDVSTRRDYSTGIAALGSGLVSVTADTVSTRGALSAGVYAVGSQVDVTAGTVTTFGDAATGVYVAALEGPANIHVGSVSTAGDHAAGVRGYSAGGGVNVTVTGAITTGGRNGYGVLAFGAGAVSIENQGSIATTGTFARGIYATTAGAPIAITNSGEVTTSGLQSDGIRAIARGGAVSVQSTGTVGVSGDFSSGILAVVPRSGRGGGDRETAAAAAGADVTVVADHVTTSGRFDSGILALNYSGGAIRIDAADVVSSGDQSKGVVAVSIGDVSIHAGDVSSTSNAIATQGIGDRDITVTGAISARDATAITAYTHRGDATVTVAAGASVVGGGKRNEAYSYGGGGIAIAAGYGVATINNAGLIATKGDGWAIEAFAAPDYYGAFNSHAVVNNSGTIVGGIKLTGADDQMSNSGAVVVTRDSDFGGGDDLFVNTGVVKVLTGETKAGAAGFLGLERFDNTGGLIELRNGHAGDVFTLTGDYVAAGDARVGLDLRDGKADKLVIAGLASGKTTILLAGAGLTGSTPLTLVEAGAGSTGSFVIANPDVGLVHYELEPGAGAGVTGFAAAAAGPATWSLSVSAGAPVYAALKLEESARTAWTRSAEAWSTHLAALRGDAWGSGPSSARFWGQAWGSTVNRDAEVATSFGKVSTDYRQTDAGVQFGGDLLRRTTRFGDVAWGVTGGYGTADVKSKDGLRKSDFKTFNLGGYAALTRGAAFANALVKFDRHDIKTSDALAGYSANLNGDSWGAQVEVGRRFGGDRFAFEPTAGLTWVSSGLDGLTVQGQSLAFDDADGLTGRIGGRVSGKQRLANGTGLVFYAGAAAARNFSGDQRLTLTSGGVSQAVAAKDDGAFGQVTLGVSARTPHGLSTYLEGDGDFGAGRSGTGLRLGARFNF